MNSGKIAVGRHFRLLFSYLEYFFVKVRSPFRILNFLYNRVFVSRNSTVNITTKSKNVKFFNYSIYAHTMDQLWSELCKTKNNIALLLSQNRMKVSWNTINFIQRNQWLQTTSEFHASFFLSVSLFTLLNSTVIFAFSSSLCVSRNFVCLSFNPTHNNQEDCNLGN